MASITQYYDGNIVVKHIKEEMIDLVTGKTAVQHTLDLTTELFDLDDDDKDVSFVKVQPVMELDPLDTVAFAPAAGETPPVLNASVPYKPVWWMDDSDDDTDSDDEEDLDALEAALEEAQQPMIRNMMTGKAFPHPGHPGWNGMIFN